MSRVSDSGAMDCPACGAAKVLAQFRKEARRRRVGYQTLINEVLAEHVRKGVA